MVGTRNILLLCVLLSLIKPATALAFEPELIGKITADTNLTLFGKRIASFGDQNGDGYDDFLTWDFRYQGYLFLGGTTLSNSPAITYVRVTPRFNVLDDLNGDSFADIVFPTRTAFYEHKLNLYYGGPDLDTSRDLWFGLDTLYGRGYSSRGYDIDADGIDEIISSGTDAESIVFFKLGEISDSLPDLVLRLHDYPYPDNAFGDNIIVSDFNGDGFPDLATSLRLSPSYGVGGSMYMYWGGPEFDTIPDVVLSRPGGFVEGAAQFSDVLEDIGDFNGDGWDDILVSSGGAGYDELSWIYFCGPNFDIVPDLCITLPIQIARKAGDVNDDGYSDIIVSYPLQWPDLGYVALFFGGPNADSLPDFRFDNSSFEGFQTEFGLDCSGVGDVNGDGIDDFAFSAVESPTTGVIYVFAGSDHLTSVDTDFEVPLPNDYILHQNYPNPFNLKTFISFELPNASEVTLTIYNVLGATVRVLYSGMLPGGYHSISWDGKDKSGRISSSGIYFYKLNWQSGEITKKMLLLK